MTRVAIPESLKYEAVYELGDVQRRVPRAKQIRVLEQVETGSVGPAAIATAEAAAAIRHQSSEVSMTLIRADNQPVTQITIVDSEPDKQAEALSVMTERARFMARQPGFISISLHRSLDGRRIVNYVQWQNRDLLRSAHQLPEFRKEWGHFDQLTDEIDPNLYEVTEVID